MTFSHTVDIHVDIYAGFTGVQLTASSGTIVQEPSRRKLVVQDLNGGT